MKKIFAIFAAISMLALSCQEEISPVNEDAISPVKGKLTATILKTKVNYTETPEMNLQPAWEVGDKIIGFDDAGNTYTLTVASVSAETATLNGTVPDGALHLIYKSGAQASDISSKTLAVDYTAQAGDKTMPAVMLADGTVTDGSCNFAFTNAGSVIGISAMKRVPLGSKITKITISGKNLSAATIALSGSALALTATENVDDFITVEGLNLTVTDAAGTLSAPVFVAVPAGAIIAKVSVIISDEVEKMKIPSTAADREGIDYVTIGGKKWAKWNVGASGETDYGWYFDWGDTGGYVFKNGLWVSTRAEYPYSLLPKTVGSSEYLYIKTQSFYPNTHYFWCKDTPFQTQNTGSALEVKFTKYLGSTSSLFKDPSATDEDALKTTLDPEDDAAHVNWGGTWRMPTKAELTDLISNSTVEWKTDYKGSGLNGPLFTSKIAGEEGHSVFFPAAGHGNESTLNKFGERGYYWSSTVSVPPYPSNCAVSFYLLESKPYVTPDYYRMYGYSVRPISD